MLLIDTPPLDTLSPPLLPYRYATRIAIVAFSRVAAIARDIRAMLRRYTPLILMRDAAAMLLPRCRDILPDDILIR